VPAMAPGMMAGQPGMIPQPGMAPQGAPPTGKPAHCCA